MNNELIKIPLPTGGNIYSYCDDLARYHERLQALYKKLAHDNPKKFLSRDIPSIFQGNHSSNRRKELILPRINRSGRPILALEPHPDDLILSAGGTLIDIKRPLHVLTFFSRSSNVTSNRDHCLSKDEFSNIRQKENEAALNVINASVEHLNLPEASWPFSKKDEKYVDLIIDLTTQYLSDHPDVELFAQIGRAHV